jgi:hypothetical protein
VFVDKDNGRTRTISFNEELDTDESAPVGDSEGSGLPRERTRSCISAQACQLESIR